MANHSQNELPLSFPTMPPESPKQKAMKTYAPPPVDIAQDRVLMAQITPATTTTATTTGASRAMGRFPTSSNGRAGRARTRPATAFRPRELPVFSVFSMSLRVLLGLLGPAPRLPGSTLG